MSRPPSRPSLPPALFPAKLQPLFLPARYKVLYGGRGSGKSWSVARALVIRAASERLRILCAREFQASIEESVHKLLAGQIAGLGLSALFTVRQRAIVCGPTGSEFLFEGLRYNVAKIKSMEGIDVAWVEEAQTVPEASWAVLVPTIRKAGSEIWVTFNPDMEHDAAYRRFVLHPPPGALVAKVNWDDNPWFPDELRAEKDLLRARDYPAYLHVWEGECRRVVASPLWTREALDAAREAPWSDEEERRALLARLARIVVAVDPSGCHGPDDKRSDEIGIVVAGVGHDGIARVLDDRSGRYSPEGWARECAEAWRWWRADRVVAEKNFGGALVAATLRAADPRVPVREVNASRGKAVRAEPIAALYARGQVRHVGHFAELERQMLLFSATGYKGPRSPDRADALVWALTELTLEDNTGVLQYYRELRQERQAESGSKDDGKA